MKKHLLALGTAILVAGIGLPARDAKAQAACEAVAALSPAIVGAGAINTVGESMAGMMDRITQEIEQAVPTLTEGEAGEPPAPRPRPQPEANPPAPLVPGC